MNENDEKSPGKKKAWPEYQRAMALAMQDQRAEAQQAFHELLETAGVEAKLRALARNDLSALTAVEGDLLSARQGFEEALLIDCDCIAARENLGVLHAEHEALLAESARVNADTANKQPQAAAGGVAASTTNSLPPIKVAILSFLFNWPSTGGGIIHTVELARFLGKAGYSVAHFYARYPFWGIGQVTEELPFASNALDFDESTWNVATIQSRFRQAVDRFGPDQVIITDSWNMKPLLAEAVEDYSYLLRFQAMECLCPLNNVRLLFDPDGEFRQCPMHQLATPAECKSCLELRGSMSGPLHQRERVLSGVGSKAYHARLLRILRRAHAVLVVNPLTETMISPYASNTRVVTAGMDAARFPWPGDPAAFTSKPIKTIFFAGLLDEWMKGFFVLQQACAQLWERRQDFELVVTGDINAPREKFVRCVGWLSQSELAKQFRSVDIVVLPTIAQEALGRTAVEAMAAGRPVVASRIGGLPSTIQDGVTGLLFEPGNVADLAGQIETLLNDDGLRKQMGLAGRRRFEAHFSWDVIIDRHYRPLLQYGRSPERVAAFVPSFVEQADRERLFDEASQFIKLRRSVVLAMFEAYQALHQVRGYARSQGEQKTLCFEEAFLLYILIATQRPPNIIGVGPQIDKSMRRVLDIKNALGLDSRVVAYCPADKNRDLLLSEVEVIEENFEGQVTKVLEPMRSGLIFNDAHGPHLLQEIIRATLTQGDWMLALHDCGKGLCNPRMAIARDDPEITSTTGVWERHILAELCGLDDPLSCELDDRDLSTHRLRIFDTRHGLGVFLPAKAVTRKQSND